MKISLTHASLLVICLGVTHALNCYTCSSVNNEGHCGDPFHKPPQNQDMSCMQSFNQVFSTYKSDFSDQFTEKQDVCVKLVHKDAINGHTIKIERGCASADYENVCKFLGAGNLPNVQCHICKKNLCNGAASVSALSAAAVALASIFVALLKL